MEPPPAAPPFSAAAAAAGNINYPDSVDSSPRSRNTDSWDEPLLASIGGGGAKLRLMCSYGGHIVPRPHDKSLCYVGGDTRIVVADRHSTLSDLHNRLSKTLLNGRSFTLKYQLPNEDLDSLISVTTDEDFENMIEEYDRLTTAAANNTTQKSSRLRLFLFPLKPDSSSSIESLLESSTKSEDWFLNALNGSSRGFSESASVNCLLGLDDDVAIAGNANSSLKDVEAQLESFGNVKGVSGNSNKQGVQDVQSVPDSPMLETTSSFGSTSSPPSLANLSPIRVHVEDQKAAVGIEEQFSQMSVGASVQKLDDGGFSALSSPPTVLTTAAAAGMPSGSASVLPSEYSNRVFFDDERSEQGILGGYRKPPQTLPQQHPQPPVTQFKPTGGVDLASPDSVSSDSSTTNPLSHQRSMIYQDQVFQNPSGRFSPVDPKFSDPNSRVHVQQVQDSAYLLPTQFDQNHQQLNPQQQQQQFIQTGTHYINHHPSGAVPITSFYPIYPSQQQPLHPQHLLDQQNYPVFYLPSRQAQAFNNMPIHQSNYSETGSTRPQTPPPLAMIPPSATYSTARNAPAPLFQVPSSQHQPQYTGFSQFHHPSQSMAPNSAAASNYAYEFADPAHAPIYYNQPLGASQLAAQYQTMTSASAGASPDASAQLPTDNIKQQIRTSQP